MTLDLTNADDLDIAICVAEGRIRSSRHWLKMKIQDRKFIRAMHRRTGPLATRRKAGGELNDCEDSMRVHWRLMNNERRNRDHLKLHMARKSMVACAAVAPMRNAAE